MHVAGGRYRSSSGNAFYCNENAVRFPVAVNDVVTDDAYRGMTRLRYAAGITCLEAFQSISRVPYCGCL